MTNKEQAIKKIKGPTIIIAGAGTGKSYTIKKKANYLVNELKLYKPSEILCLTFSNEATDSLKKGMKEELKTTESVTVKTFHSFCGDILREDGHLVGVDESFEIILPDDAKIILNKNLGISPYWANRYVSTIMSAKDFGVSLNSIKKYAEDLVTKKDYKEEFVKAKEFLQTFHLLNKEEQKENKDYKKQQSEFIKNIDEYERFNNFIEAWEKYDIYKTNNSLLDFSDLNYYVLQLFRQYDSDKYVNQFKYVLVDEFQDTNKLQFELISFIAKHGNITVVGDLNQSIYGFRGSYKESFEHFKDVFKADDSCIFKLEESRRSPNTILDISYDLIKNNYDNLEDCVHIKNFEGRIGEKVKVVSLLNAQEEARYIADIVQDKINLGIPKEKICILYRTHKQSHVIKRALELKEIPVISAGKIDLLQKPEIRTIIAYLSILNNLIQRTGTGEQAWWHLFHYKNTLSAEDTIKLARSINKINKKDISLEEQKGIDEILLTSLNSLDLSNEGREIVSRIVSKLQELILASSKALPELILDIYEIIGLNRLFSYSRSVENIEGMLNLKKFYELASSYYERHDKTLSGFIKYLEIVDQLGVNIDASKILNVDAVKMMTVHASKGLEFDTVIVCNLATDRFPVTRTHNEPLIPKELLPDLEIQIKEWRNQGLDEKSISNKIKEYDKSILLLEERRLCYVAFTRAMNDLIITFAKDYKGEPDSASASPFLDEINYLNNERIEFVTDDDEKSMILSPTSHIEEHKALLKQQLLHSLDIEDYSSITKRLLKYLTCRDGEIVKSENVNIDEDELLKEIKKCNKESVIKFDSSTITFSPSSLITYTECPKRYELERILQMPQRGEFDKDGSGAVIGSFVHYICELGVRDKYDSLEKFEDLAKKEHKGEYKKVNLDDALYLLKIFWERNKSKLKGNSEVELELIMEIDGFRFYGLADRVDTLEDGTVEIIDYKTNKDSVSGIKRRIQLGFYALALIEKGYKVSRLTLDMLRLDKPIEMTVDGDYVKGPDGRTKGFKISDVKLEILDLCKSIADDYEKGFKETEDESNCKFCGYKFYCKKWEV